MTRLLKWIQIITITNVCFSNVKNITVDNDLLKKVDKMSDEDKKNLIVHLQNSLQSDTKMTTVDERYAQLVSIAEDMFEYKMKTGRRSMEDVMIRRFVAYRLRIEGFSLSSIGHAMGKNHATVVHLINQVKDYFALPNLYKQDIRRYLEFDSRAIRNQNDRDI